jgi:hypothetical protein
MGRVNQIEGLTDDDVKVTHYGKDKAALDAYLAKLRSTFESAEHEGEDDGSSDNKDG